MDKETLIELYFENALNSEQERQFQELLKNDSSFSEEFSFHIKLKTAVSQESRKELKHYLQHIEENRKGKKKNVFYYAAAVITVLIFLGSFVFSNFNQTNPDLYDHYFEPYPNIVEPIVRNSNTPSLKSEAFLAYEQGNFTQSALLFKNLASSSQEDYASFYEGISLMAAEQFKEAKKVFLTTSFSNEFEEKKNWYLSLVYFKLGDTDNTHILLNEIIGSKSFNYEKAKKLRNQLPKPK